MLAVGLPITLLALTQAVVPGNPDEIRRLADRDLAAALVQVESLLETSVGGGCDTGHLEIVLAAGDIFLAAARDGQIQQRVLSHLTDCKASLISPALVARAEKLRAYATPNRPEGLRHAKASVKAAREQANRRLLAESLQIEAFILRVLGMLSEADRNLQEAIEIAADLDDAVLKARLYSDYAMLRKQSGDPSSALEYVNKALLIAEQEGAKRIAISVRLHRALINGSLGDFTAAEQEQQQLLQETQASGNTSFQAILLNNLASQYLRQERYAEALSAAARAVQLARGIPSAGLEMRSLANLGSGQLHLGQTAAGIANIEKALELAREIGSPDVQAGLMQELGRIKYESGEFAKAYEYLAEGSKISEALSHAIREALLSESQARFDVLIKQNEIHALEAELAWNNERLWQQRYINILGALAALLFVGLIAVIAMRYRQMRMMNRELKNRAQQFEEFSQRDALTGLFNRRYFEASLQKAVESRNPSSGPAGYFCVLLIDIDHFKNLNDTEGHVAGDEALIQFAERLKTALRRDETLARWGGEEFCVLATLASVQDMHQMSERLLTAISTRAFMINGLVRAMTCSIGAVITPVCGGETASNWRHYVACADTAMYMAKHKGRNRAVCFELTAPLDESSLAAICRDPEAASSRGLLTVHAGANH